MMTQRTFPYFVIALRILSPWARAETATEAIARATGAVERAAPRAQADSARPIFHVTAPAQWINDPNGPIFHKGVYHFFYQLHPFSDADGPKYWGHVRSRDLAKWEHLPIALAPSGDFGGGSDLVRLLHRQWAGRADDFLHQHRARQVRPGSR